jgi:hypothetical protein
VKRLAGRAQLRRGARGVREFGQHAGALDPPSGILPIYLGVGRGGVRRPGPVTSPEPLVEQRLQVEARLGRQPLARRQLGRAKQGRVVFRVDLDDLLVEGGRLRDEPVAGEVLGNPRVLADGLIDLPRPDVEITQDVRRRQVPGILLDERRVFGDRRVQAPLAQELLSSPKGIVAVHERIDSRFPV